MISNGVVSIIIPIYNAEAYLTECIQSVLAQTYTSWELILVNDGSKDKSLHICQEYANRDSRIKVFSQQNAGPSAARNRGIAKASGDFICFIDSDDTVTSSYLSDMLQYDADWVLSGVIHVHSDGHEQLSAMETSYSSLCLEKQIAYLDYTGRCHGPVAKMYHSAIIKENKIQFPIDLDYGEDLMFNLSYLCHINTLALVNSCNYRYIHRDTESLTNRVKPCKTMMNYVVQTLAARLQVARIHNFTSGEYQQVIEHEAAFYFWQTMYSAIKQLKGKACTMFCFEFSNKVDRSYQFNNSVHLSIRYRITRKLFQHLPLPIAILLSRLL